VSSSSELIAWTDVDESVVYLMSKSTSSEVRVMRTSSRHRLTSLTVAAPASSTDRRTSLNSSLPPVSLHDDRHFVVHYVTIEKHGTSIAFCASALLTSSQTLRRLTQPFVHNTSVI